MCLVKVTSRSRFGRCVQVRVCGAFKTHLNSLVVEQRVNSCIACFVVCFVHFYSETSPVCTDT